MRGKLRLGVGDRGLWRAVQVLVALGAMATTGARAGALYGPAGVSPEAVKQGVLGSCYFHASIVAIARTAPEVLRNAISPNGGGGYRIHFTSGPEEIVFAEDLAYGRAHGYDLSDGDWVLALMRGYAQRQVRASLATAIEQSTLIPGYIKPMALSWIANSTGILAAYDRAIRSVVSQEGVLNKAMFKDALARELSSMGVPAAQAATLSGFLEEQGFFDGMVAMVAQNGEVFGAYKSMGQGGIPVRVIAALMGPAHAGMVADRERTMQQLHRVHEGRAALVVGTKQQPPNASFEHAEWWVSGHAYAVMDYDPSTQTVRLHNPWGHHPDPKGDFSLPLSTFLAGYESLSYSD